MKNNLQIKKMVGLASLAAIVIVLQLIASYLPFKFFGVSITLALIPIAVGAILYGPKGGAVLGFVLGIMVIVDPSTLAVFMPHNPFMTIVLCLLKTTLAGFVSGILFKVLYKKNFVIAAGLASIIVPIVNTLTFTLGALLFFKDIYGPTGLEALLAIIGVIWLNFVVEMAVNTLLAPVVVQVVRIASRNFDLGISLNQEDDVEIEKNDYLE